MDFFEQVRDRAWLLVFGVSVLVGLLVLPLIRQERLIVGSELPVAGIILLVLFVETLWEERNGVMAVPRTDPFDRYSDEYEEWFRRNAELYEAEPEATRSLMPPPEARCAEVGGGSGKFAPPAGASAWPTSPCSRLVPTTHCNGVSAIAVREC